MLEPLEGFRWHLADTRIGVQLSSQNMQLLTYDLPRNSINQQFCLLPNYFSYLLLL